MPHSRFELLHFGAGCLAVPASFATATTLEVMVTYAAAGVHMGKVNRCHVEAFFGQRAQMFASGMQSSDLSLKRTTVATVAVTSARTQLRPRAWRTEAIHPPEGRGMRLRTSSRLRSNCESRNWRNSRFIERPIKHDLSCVAKMTRSSFAICH